MLPSSRKTLLLALFAVTACFLPIVHSLSIPPPHTTKVIHDGVTEDPTTTKGPDVNDGFGDLVLQAEDTDPSGTDSPNLNGSLAGKGKPVMEVVDIIFRPFRPPSILVMDFFRKPNDTAGSSSSSSPSDEDDDDGIPTSETSSEEKGGTTVSSTDGSAETDSREKHRGIIISSISTDSDGRDNNDVTASRAQETNGIFPHKPVIGMAVQEENGPTSQMTSSSVAAQRQFSMDNEDIDDARRVSDKQNSNPDGNDDGDSASLPLSTVAASTTSQSKKNDNSSSSSDDGNNNQRRKRETHQMGNISKEDHDDSSFSKNLTGKFQPDDMTKSSNNGDNVSSSNGVDSGSSSITTTTSNDPAAIDVDNDTDDNGQHETTDGHKSGTVKVFLEILQLVPLSNSTTLTTSSKRNVESNSATSTTTTATTTTPANDKEDTDTKTVVQSMKANSNQEFSSANSLAVNTTRSEKRAAPEKTLKVAESRKRVARSATTKEVSEKKGNPSTSPTTSASPSSRTTSKPLTGKDAPAAPSPSANASTKKASSTVPDDVEGPPLENVTQPTGRSDDD